MKWLLSTGKQNLGMSLTFNKSFSTHGFNRTGLLIVSYLTERLDMSVSEALKLFSLKRNGGIYKDYIVEAIFEKYKKDDEECPTVTIPSWVDKKKLERQKD